MNDLKIMILTDGKIGDLVQCRGVAARIADSSNIVEKVIAPDWWHSLPFPFIGVQKSDLRGQPDSPFNDPLPDLILASGRRTIPYLRTFKAKRSSNKKPMMVFLKDPRSGRGVADLVWAPVHDRLNGTDVITTHTSPHGLTSEALASAGKSAAHRFADFQGKTTGVILGGDSGSVKWSDKTADDFANVVRSLPDDETILVTPSRRTPDCLKKAIQNIADHRTLWYWDGSGDNPYFEILTHCNRLVVTGDSHNMVSECLATEKPVYVHQPPGLSKKLQKFLQAMETLNAIKSAGDWDPFDPIKIDATLEISEAIKDRISTHYNL